MRTERTELFSFFSLKTFLIALAVGVVSQGALAQSYKLDPSASERAYQGAVVAQVREDAFDGPPDGPKAPNHISNGVDPAKYVSQGIYRSPYLGFEIRVPKILGTERTHVHQALISTRRDGSPVTAHVLFIANDQVGAAALVATRLRDDRPKDTESVLSQFEPRSAEEAAALAARGLKSARANGPFGPAVQRTIRNRVLNSYFPYRIGVDPSPNLRYYGATRYVVVDGFLLEFSVVVADPSGRADLEAIALEQLDLYMAGLVKNPK